jgi:hypothetical protein
MTLIFIHKHKNECNSIKMDVIQPEERSRYSDWLRAGRNRGCTSSPGGGKNFHVSMLPKPKLRPTHPPTQWISETLSTGVKRPWRETDCSHRTRAEATKILACTTTLPYVFTA